MRALFGEFVQTKCLRKPIQCIDREGLFASARPLKGGQGRVRRVHTRPAMTTPVLAGRPAGGAGPVNPGEDLVVMGIVSRAMTSRSNGTLTVSCSMLTVVYADL